MKVLDGSLADSLSSRFGQFSIQKTVDPNGEKVCSYNKRTFFSWTVHCLRFRFSNAYRENVMAERHDILCALDRSWQEQTVSDSDDGHDPSKNMRSANVTLSSRRRFNRRVSELLQSYEAPAEPGEPQATTDEVTAEPGGTQTTKDEAQATKDEVTAEPGGTQTTKDEAPAEMSETQATTDEVTAETSETQATTDEVTAEPGGTQTTTDEPQTTKDEVTAETSEPQVTKDEVTAEPGEPQTTKDEVTAEPGGTQTTTDEPQTTKDEVTAETSETQVTAGEAPAETGEIQATAAQQNLLNTLSDLERNETGRVLCPQEEIGDDQTERDGCTAPPYALQIVEEGLEAAYAANVPDPNGSDKNGELCKHFLTYHTFTGDESGEAGEELFKWEDVSGTFDSSKAYPTIQPENLPKEGWHLRVPSDSSIKYAAKIADAVREMTPDDAIDFVSQKFEAKGGDAEEQYITSRFAAFLFVGLGDALLVKDSAI